MALTIPQRVNLYNNDDDVDDYESEKSTLKGIPFEFLHGVRSYDEAKNIRYKICDISFFKKKKGFTSLIHKKK
jgi:hypothetical protein